MNETPRSAPPNFVPTLTEVVRPDPIATPLALPAEFANLLEGWPAGSNALPSPVPALGLVQMPWAARAPPLPVLPLAPFTAQIRFESPV